MSGNTETQELDVYNRPCQKTSKRNCSFLDEKHLCRGETKLNLYQNDWKIKVWCRRETVRDPKHAKSSVRHDYSMMMFGCHWNWATNVF